MNSFRISIFFFFLFDSFHRINSFSDLSFKSRKKHRIERKQRKQAIDKRFTPTTDRYFGQNWSWHAPLIWFRFKFESWVIFMRNICKYLSTISYLRETFDFFMEGAYFTDIQAILKQKFTKTFQFLLYKEQQQQAKQLLHKIWNGHWV